MNLDFAPEDVAFRAEARAFIEESYPIPAENRTAGRADESYRDEAIAWHRILHEKGWIAPAWPKEYGGCAWSLTRRYIWDQELASAGAALLPPFGLAMVGPVIYTFGTDAQKARFLPRILSGEDWWCQGYSEPGSGSDLASLRMRAERKGDVYVLNGQKTWTTLAQYANWIFCLTRTDPNPPKKQEGISFILVDMKTPGVSVRPITTIDGGQEINDVFFENVEVPVENRIGEEGKGWTYAKFLLSHERSGIAQTARARRAAQRLRDIAGRARREGAPLLEAADVRDKLCRLDLSIAALEFTELRALATENASGGPGLESSILKIRGTEIQQRISEILVEMAGEFAWPAIDRRAPPSPNEAVAPPDFIGAVQEYANLRKTSIYGGSNEIQRNIIAKLALGL